MLHYLIKETEHSQNIPYSCGKKYRISGLPGKAATWWDVLVRCWFHSILTSSSSPWIMEVKQNCRISLQVEYSNQHFRRRTNATAGSCFVFKKPSSWGHFDICCYKKINVSARFLTFMQNANVLTHFLATNTCKGDEQSSTPSLTNSRKVSTQKLDIILNRVLQKRSIRCKYIFQ